MKHILRLLLATALLGVSTLATAQRYGKVIDKTIAVVGNEMILISDLEQGIQEARLQGMASDEKARCELLERMLESKLFLLQARLDSLSINQDMVQSQLSQHIDMMRTRLGGDEAVEEAFGKPLYKLRQEWKKQMEDMSLTQQEQMEIANQIPDLTPADVKKYIDTTDAADLPIVPIKYQLSQVCLYPDREAANLAVKEKLLSLRERILNGEKFSTLARIYSEDPGSARKGGELGMASKSIFWPAFSDVAMSLKPGTISQVVETPDGFHIIEVIEKSGDMFNARHILLKPQYTVEDREHAFHVLDSIRTEINNKALPFELAARFYSEDNATRTNGGQMADPNTGSSYFEIDQLKPQDYVAIKDLKEGEISEPIESLDNKGREGNLVYKIIRVDKIIPAHTATFQNDFTQISEQVKNQLQMKAIDEYLRKKIKDTKIKIDPMFKDCEFRNAGWYDKIKKK